MSRTLPKHRAREYETIFIMHPESATDGIDKVAGRCQGVIDKLEGKLLKAENWGRRRLAYPVRKQAKGVYIYLRYLGYQGMVHELERNLRLLDPVLKYLTVKVDEDVDPEARPVSDADISFIPKFVEDAPPAAVEEAAPATEEAAPAKEEAAPAKEEAPAVAKEAPAEVKEEAAAEAAPVAEAAAPKKKEAAAEPEAPAEPEAKTEETESKTEDTE